MKFSYTITLAWEIIPSFRITAFTSPFTVIVTLHWLKFAGYLSIQSK